MLSDSEHKMSVVVLFGGMSSEHEVSRVSAGTFVDQLDRQRYELLTIGITKEGRWLYTEADSAQMADGSWEELPGNMPCVLSPDRADHGLILFTPAGQVEKVHVDVVIPVLHGLWGEDGTVQGLLELAGIPHVGCGVLASAVCMDKAVANAMFDASGIPHTKWLSATRWEIESDPDGVCDGVIAKLGWPIFVKPANAGSSVGITKAHDRDELKAAIRLALANDRKVVFEAFVDGHEVECAVSGVELEAKQVDCHHKKPLVLGGNDSYQNLIIVSAVVHILIHSSNERTIRKYLKVLNLDKKQLAKLNKLRVMAEMLELVF